jgi:hypothetical protein
MRAISIENMPEVWLPYLPEPVMFPGEIHGSCVSREPSIAPTDRYAAADARYRLAARRPTLERPAAIRLFFGCSSVIAVDGPPSGNLPAPSSPGIPPEDRRAAGRSSRCPAVHFVLVMTLGVPLQRTTRRPS